MKQIRSHWRLAWRSFLQALSATIQIPLSMYKANRYSTQKFNYLRDQREYYERLESQILSSPMDVRCKTLIFDENYKFEKGA